MNAALVFGFTAVVPNLGQTLRGRRTERIPSAYVSMARRCFDGRTGWFPLPAFYCRTIHLRRRLSKMRGPGY